MARDHYWQVPAQMQGESDRKYAKRLRTSANALRTIAKDKGVEARRRLLARVKKLDEAAEAAFRKVRL